MVAMAVSPMHEHMHEKTAGEECERQIRRDMPAMIKKDVSAYENEEHDQSPSNHILHVRDYTPLDLVWPGTVAMFKPLTPVSCAVSLP